MYKVSFYTFSGNVSPIEEYLNSIEESVRAKILTKIHYIKVFGLARDVPDFKKISSSNMKDKTFDDYLKKQLKNPKFKKEWDKLQPQFEITRELIKARIEGKISQRELAKRAKTTQAVLSRIENMTVSPSIGLLQKIASAFDKKLEIKFT